MDECWGDAVTAASKALAWVDKTNQHYDYPHTRKHVVTCAIVLTGTPRVECTRRGRSYGQLLRVRCECMAQTKRPRYYGYDHLGDVETIAQARILWEKHLEAIRN